MTKGKHADYHVELTPNKVDRILCAVHSVYLTGLLWSDARRTSTSYLTENLAKTDEQILKLKRFQFQCQTCFKQKKRGEMVKEPSWWNISLSRGAKQLQVSCAGNIAHYSLTAVLISMLVVTLYSAWNTFSVAESFYWWSSAVTWKRFPDHKSSWTRINIYSR